MRLQGQRIKYQYTFNRTTTDNQAQFSLDTKNFASCNSSVTTDNITIPMLDNMNIGFTASPASQSLPSSTVTINNTTNTGVWTYLWDFGDGSTSTNSTVTSHTYATYGNYTITLTVTSNDVLYAIPNAAGCHSCYSSYC